MEKPSVHLLGLGCPALKIRLVEAHIHATKLQSLKMCKIVSGGGFLTEKAVSIRNDFLFVFVCKSLVGRLRDKLAKGV